MIHLKYFEGYLNDPLYKEVSYEEFENFARESVRKNIKESITKDDYVKIQKYLHKMFDIYPISKINNKTKEEFEIDVKVNIKYIYGNKEDGYSTSTSSTYKSLIESLNDGRLFFYIKRDNPYNYPKNTKFDFCLYKIEGEIWLLNFDGLNFYQLEGIEGLEDMIKNKEFKI